MEITGRTISIVTCVFLLRPPPPTFELLDAPVLTSPPEPDSVVVLDTLAGDVVVEAGGEDREDVVEGDGEDEEEVVAGGGDDEEDEEQADCAPSPFDMIWSSVHHRRGQTQGAELDHVVGGPGEYVTAAVLG